MKISLFNRRYVITKHRGELVKSVSKPSPKDLEVRDLEAENDPVLLPRVRVAKLPQLRIQRETHYNRYQTKASYERALQAGAPLLKSEAQVIDSVRAFVEARRQQHRTQPGVANAPELFLLGEDHESAGSLAATLTVIADLARRPGRPTVLIETDEAQLGVKLGNARLWHERTQHAEASSASSASSVLTDETEEDRDFLKSWIEMEAALMAGFSVSFFDPKGDTAKDREEREAAMLVEIQKHVSKNEGPVVVLTGANHVPPLHEHFERQPCRSIAIASLHQHQAWSAYGSRQSYVLSHPDIMCFQETEALYKAPLPDRVDGALGLELTSRAKRAVESHCQANVTRKNVEQGLARVTSVTNTKHLGSWVKQNIDRSLEAARNRPGPANRPALIALGEIPGNESAAVAALEALIHQRGAGQPTLLFQPWGDIPKKEKWGQDEWMAAAKAMNQHATHPSRLSRRMEAATAKDPKLLSTLYKVGNALKLGCDVQLLRSMGGPADHPSPAVRVNGMLHQIQDRLSENSGPVIVSAYTYCMPEVVEYFQQGTDMAVLAQVPTKLPKEADLKRQLGYVLTHPAVSTFSVQ